MVRPVSLVKVAPRRIAALLIVAVVSCIWLAVVSQACIERPDEMAGIVIVLPLPLLFLTVAVLTRRMGRKHEQAELQEEAVRIQQNEEWYAWYAAECARREAIEAAEAAREARMAQEAEEWAAYYAARGWQPAVIAVRAASGA